MRHEEGLLSAIKPVSFSLLFAYSSRRTGHRPASITEQMSTQLIIVVRESLVVSADTNHQTLLVRGSLEEVASTYCSTASWGRGVQCSG